MSLGARRLHSVKRQSTCPRRRLTQTPYNFSSKLSTNDYRTSPKHSRFALRMNLVSFWSVQNLAAPQKPADALPISHRHFSAQIVLSFLFLAALWFVLCRELSGEWLVNEQYSFGWFVPLFALYLFWLRWQDRPPPEIPNSKSQARNNGFAALIAIPALVVLLPVRLFEIANPEWRG